MSIKMHAGDGLMACHLRPMFGTFVAIECRAADTESAERAIAAAFDALRCVEERMHPTRRGSDLAAIRAAQIGSPVVVHPWTVQVLALSQRVHTLSEGCFDPCLPELPGHIGDIDVLKEAIALAKRRMLDAGQQQQQQQQ